MYRQLSSCRRYDDGRPDDSACLAIRKEKTVAEACFQSPLPVTLSQWLPEDEFVVRGMFGRSSTMVLSGS